MSNNNLVSFTHCLEQLIQREKKEGMREFQNLFSCLIAQFRGRKDHFLVDHTQFLYSQKWEEIPKISQQQKNQKKTIWYIFIIILYLFFFLLVLPSNIFIFI